MADNKKDAADVYHYDHGLSESHGPRVLPFLKITYAGIIIFAVAYFVMYINGDGSKLVELFNELTGR